MSQASLRISWKHMAAPLTARRLMAVALDPYLPLAPQPSFPIAQLPSHSTFWFFFLEKRGTCMQDPAGVAEGPHGSRGGRDSAFAAEPVGRSRGGTGSTQATLR